MVRRATTGLLLLLLSLAAHAASGDDLVQAIALYASRQPSPALALINKVVSNLSAPVADRARAYLFGALCRQQLGEVEATRRNFLVAYSLDPTLELPPGVPPETAGLAATARAAAIATLKVRISAASDAALSAMARQPPRPPPTNPR